MEKSPEGYALHAGVPTPTDYVRLRQDSGLTPRTLEQANRALPGSWVACHVIDVEDGRSVSRSEMPDDV